MEDTAKSTPLIQGMRDSYFDALYPFFMEDKLTMFISADNGAPSMDKFSDLPNQFRNVGIAEQQLIGMACGLALEGRKVWVYAIDPFVTLRCLEFIKLDMCAMNLPITAVGVGAGYTYDIMGPTHHGVGVIASMRTWPNLSIYQPSDVATSKAVAALSYLKPGPKYVRFDRKVLPDLQKNLSIDSFNRGIRTVREGKNNDLCIIATGAMVHTAIHVASKLKEQPEMLDATVVDFYRLKPANTEALLDYLNTFDLIVTLEEDFIAGGIGSIISEIATDNDLLRSNLQILRIGQDDQFVYDLGGREAIWQKHGLDANGVTLKITDWLRR